MIGRRQGARWTKPRAVSLALSRGLADQIAYSMNVDPSTSVVEVSRLEIKSEQRKKWQAPWPMPGFESESNRRPSLRRELLIMPPNARDKKQRQDDECDVDFSHGADVKGELYGDKN